MDLRSTLLLTVQGFAEANNKRSSLDFKSRSILTSLRNQEKTLAELLSKIFIENKEVMVLINALLNDGYVTTDPALSFAAANAAAEQEAARRAAAAVAQRLESERRAESERQALLLMEREDKERARKELEAAEQRARRELEASEQRAKDEIIRQRTDADAARVAALRRESDIADAAARTEQERIAHHASESARLHREAVLAQAEAEQLAAAEAARLEDAQAQKEREREAVEANKVSELFRQKLESQRIAEELRKKAEADLQRRRAAIVERERLEAENAKREALAESLRLESEEKAHLKAQQDEIRRLEEEVRAEAAAEAERARLAAESRAAKIREQEEQLKRDEQWRRDQAAAKGVPYPPIPKRGSDSEEQVRAKERLKEIAANGGIEPSQDEKQRFIEAAREAHQLRNDSNTSPIVSEQREIPTIDDLTSSDSIDIISESEENDESEAAPKVGKTLRPTLSRFLPGILRAQNGCDSAQTANQEAPATHKVAYPEPKTAESVSPLKSVPESVTTTGSVKPRVNLQPVVSKVHAAQVKQQASLIRPAIPSTSGAPGAMQSLLSTAGGAGRDFLTSFDSKGAAPSAKPGPARSTKVKPQLRPVSVAATKAMAIKPSIKISDGIFVLSDYCIDHLDIKASEFVEQLELVRDVKSLKAVVSEIFSSINPKDKDRIAALFKAIESLNKNARP